MEIRADDDGAASAAYTVAVRSLCEFTARSGDLAIRFTPSPTAQQGIAGHIVAAARRGPHYERELPLEGRYATLRVRGRADGYDAASNRLEEFKTHRGPVEGLPLNQRGLHWAQLKMYGALLCARRALPEVELALVYFDVRTEQETALRERCSGADLATYFDLQCSRFLAWADQEVAHRRRRNARLAGLTFPHTELRAGQRRMAEAVYTAARRGRILMVQAPTGIGKTLGTLFPLLKAVAAARLDKVFYLTAKTSGRAVALHALRRLAAGPGEPTLRVVELVAKASACVHPGRRCEATSCPLAAGFYDRLPAARAAAFERPVLDRETVARLATEAAICPYYLTQELARWCDVAVGDYHYFFDSNALLHGLSVQNQWRIAVLVDEAHNLLPRAREMYSASLEPPMLAAALDCAPPRLRGAVAGVQRALAALAYDPAGGYTVQPAIDAALIAALQRAVTAITDELDERQAIDEPLLQLHFAALRFMKLADAFGGHSLCDVTRSVAGATLTIRNVSPAPFLEPRFAACATAVLFSATLGPEDYYRRLLGVRDAAWLDVDSPFAQEQLDVRIARRISTRYRDRLRSLRPIADVMAGQYRARSGNYLAFFGSFEYLQAALAVFRERFPHIPVREQTPSMTAAERERFLAEFTATSRGIAFAVLGGAFAEGVDLPGDRLIGAFIATLGMPGLSAVNAAIEQRMQSLFQAGYEYTYLYPGLQKVVQAAGRVIRSTADRGTVILMDDRYLDTHVRELLPRWWRIQCS